MNGIGGTLADVLTGVFVVAVVYVLVRPQSKAAETVKLFGDAVVTLVKTATDL